ncbi:unnamed protein product [Cuscuta campestris]|uniref:RING-CH-type domain-containing protein n=2 Tax=Cuscuta sect. Cleistogrammica TaxID=1824901 RepID=A0A484MR32_9ASTE|nr:hypothetical protein DM860_013589 [Cuscuta australis]VFQ90656.1 unnamed protein product [Cuscuta campestris]
MESLDNPGVDLEAGSGGDGVGPRRSTASSSDNAEAAVPGPEPQPSPKEEAKAERNCRICQLGLEGESQESVGVVFELGCSCKNDLATAHRLCAEAWFKIKGNRTCEICGSIASNVACTNMEAEPIEMWSESNVAAGTSAVRSSLARVETPRRFWRGHRFLNFLLACMVFAFVISWLFHFNVPS